MFLSRLINDQIVAPSKSRKSKKKKVTKPAKLSTNGISAESNGIEDGPGQDQEQEQEDPDVETSEHIQVEHTQTVSDETPVSSTFPVEEDDPGPKPELQDILKKQNGVKHDNHDLAHASAVANDQANLPEDISSDAERRLEVAAQERVRLKAEVMELRGSLESLQQRHEEDRAGIQRQLEVAESGRDHAQDQYQKLLGKVNTLKTQLGERLKADAVSLLASQSMLKLCSVPDMILGGVIASEDATRGSRARKPCAERKPSIIASGNFQP